MPEAGGGSDGEDVPGLTSELGVDVAAPPGAADPDATEVPPKVGDRQPTRLLRSGSLRPRTISHNVVASHFSTFCIAWFKVVPFLILRVRNPYMVSSNTWNWCMNLPYAA